MTDKIVGWLIIEPTDIADNKLISYSEAEKDAKKFLKDLMYKKIEREVTSHGVTFIGDDDQIVIIWNLESDKMTDKFPILQQPFCRHCTDKRATFISDKLARRVYAQYSKKFARQSFEQIKNRGGFAISEILHLLELEQE